MPAPSLTPDDPAVQHGARACDNPELVGQMPPALLAYTRLCKMIVNGEVVA